MTAQVKSRRLLFHRHELGAGKLLDLGYLYPYGGGLGKVRLAEEVELAVDVAAALLLDAVDHHSGDLEQGLALIAHAVERAGADEVFHGAAVEVAAGHAAAEVLKTAEGAVLGAAGDQLVYKAAANAFYRYKTEADVLSHDGEIRGRFVHVRRQQFYAHVPAFGDVLCDLEAVIEHRGQQRRHVLLRVAALHVRSPIGHDGVADRVRLVEGIACKVEYLVVDAVGDVLGYAALYRAVDTTAFVAVDEGDPLGVDDLVLFLGHGAAYHIRLTQREAGKAAEDLDDLLLIDDTAVGDLEYRL